ncbi:hypothetical protein O0Q50_22670 [Priestia aryabhattai]|uniref:Uncharacterized protein n=1 Tax=Priestia aryabhattai TaxID=412384 RepID=A0AAX6NDU3_PRIAR|nr:hypothetical protein [Priestia aryabhattai]MDU9693989.1 hypothetical protein [Priestia aryabhattai]NGY88713.1 hypothetical protein [Priestia megaterium]
MNKFGLLSIAMVLVNVIYFFTTRGPNVNLTTTIYILGFLSLLGIIFALISKRWTYGVLGVLTNGLILVFTFFLIIGNGIAGISIVHF